MYDLFNHNFDVFHAARSVLFFFSFLFVLFNSCHGKIGWQNMKSNELSSCFLALTFTIRCKVGILYVDWLAYSVTKKKKNKENINKRGRYETKKKNMEFCCESSLYVHERKKHPRDDMMFYNRNALFQNAGNRHSFVVVVIVAGLFFFLFSW